MKLGLQLKLREELLDLTIQERTVEHCWSYKNRPTIIIVSTSNVDQSAALRLFVIAQKLKKPIAECFFMVPKLFELNLDNECPFPRDKKI